jgi:hypothetical protein
MAINRLASQVIQIARNATGRVDSNDPLFTDAIMLQRLTDFIQLEKCTDVRIGYNRSWYEMTLVTGQGTYDINLDNENLSTINPPAYVDGYEIFWYQDPAAFYRIFPETQTYQETRPQYVLYYNNQLVFRNPPDQDYGFKVASYTVDMAITNLGDSIPQAHWMRYLGYGMSLDIFADYGELDQYNNYFPIFQRYKNMVVAREHQQNMSQRTSPKF